MIQLESVSRVYRDGDRDVHALSSLSLNVASGETVALVGRSGSGKSTLLHLVGALEWPSSGSVSVADQRLEALDDAALTRFRLRHIGFVFQFFHLLPALSVLENVLLPAELAGLPTVEGRERAMALLNSVGLADRADSYPERLSGGEQQRIAVARALLLDPPVVLADEPTGNLDLQSGQAVLDLMWNLADSRGTTLLIATHSQDVANRAQRVLELQDGRVRSDLQQADRSGATTTPTAGRPPHR